MRVEALDRLETELNPPQLAAVEHVEGPLIVFAGAGSGKTRVITYRIANLVARHRVAPWELLAVTFTNKAAGEMRHRLQSMLGGELVRDLWVGTFHAVCVRLLRRYGELVGLGKNFVIYDASDQKALMTRVCKELTLDDRRFPPQQMLHRVLREKQEARDSASFEANNYFDEVAKKAFVAYEAQLRAANAVDFEDLLLLVLRIAEGKTQEGEQLRNRFRHVLVDEFQDVNTVQYRLVRALGTSRNICAVGDDDQAIYRWRGADVRKIRNFTRDFPDARLVKLEQNYRSSGNVVAAALGVIAKSSERQPKELWTAQPAGEPVTVVAARDERDEAGWVVTQVRSLLDADVEASQIAVFYRVHAQSRVLEEAMRAENIPYQIIGGMRFFERAEVKNLLAYLRLVQNPKSDVDLQRIVNVPSRKIGQKSIERLAAVAAARGCCLFDAIVPLCQSDEVPTAAKRSLRAFADLMEGFMRAATTSGPAELAERVLDETGYAESLRAEDSAEGDSRLENLREVLSSLAEFEEEQRAAGEPATLDEYLARVTLASDADQLGDQPKVPMMTVHAAKGLEFDAVFVCGMEDRLFPLRTEGQESRCDMEEERRLCYVAFTRARKHLYVCHAATRLIYGQTRYNAPSPFLAHVPPATARSIQTEGALDLDRGYGDDRYGGRQASGWGAQARGGNGDRAGAMDLHDHHVATPRWGTGPSAPARAAGERYLELEPDEGSSGGLRVGARVRHVRFGVGVVEKVDQGADPIATVKFVGSQPKRIKLSFLAPA